MDTYVVDFDSMRQEPGNDDVEMAFVVVQGTRVVGEIA